LWFSEVWDSFQSSLIKSESRSETPAAAVCGVGFHQPNRGATVRGLRLLHSSALSYRRGRPGGGRLAETTRWTGTLRIGIDLTGADALSARRRQPCYRRVPRVVTRHANRHSIAPTGSDLLHAKDRTRDTCRCRPAGITTRHRSTVLHSCSPARRVVTGVRSNYWHAERSAGWQCNWHYIPSWPVAVKTNGHPASYE
jgi:hypothetical protein